MRLLALSSLLCVLLLCFCILSSEGRRHPPKFSKSRLCCYPFPRVKQANRKASAMQEVVLTVGNKNSKYSFQKLHQDLQAMQKQGTIQLLGGARCAPTGIEHLKPGCAQMTFMPSCGDSRSLDLSPANFHGTSEL
ncbi:hypothetical protein U0070_021241 [Myodes glareolus]|uniref:Uncharacterized protein n=1 Tax=Myodes glareolus TaxID=447135 RepID=A0AAW0H8U8_MYOGA